MTSLRQAAQQALEALEFLSLDFFMLGPISPGRESTIKAITALRAALVEDAMQKFSEINQEIEAALAEPVQEPVLVVEKEPDYWSRGHFHQGSKPHIDPTKVWNLPIGTKLYAAPPQRKPLTEEQIADAANSVRWSDQYHADFARAIERAHGIGGTNESA